MGGILTRCFQASQDHLLLLNASRYLDEMSLSPLKIVRYCLPVHAAPRREFQRNIGTPQCSTTQVKRVDNPPKVNEAGYTSTSELPLAGSISCMGLSDVEPEDETSPTGFLGQPIGAYRVTRRKLAKPQPRLPSSLPGGGLCVVACIPPG